MGLTGIPPAMFMRDGDPADPRSIRTRQQLLHAFEHLLESEQAPTVAELVRTAGVSRSAFYSHFTGIEEVGVAALREVLDQFEPVGAGYADAGGEPASAASFRDLFVHLRSHRRLCAAALAADQQVPALTELQSTLVAHLSTAISQAPEKPGDFDVGQGARFLVGGILAILLDSLERSEDDVERIVATVVSMLPGWLSKTSTLRTPLSVTSTGR